MEPPSLANLTGPIRLYERTGRDGVTHVTGHEPNKRGKCPCGSGSRYGRCCQRKYSGKRALSEVRAERRAKIAANSAACEARFAKN